MGHRISKEFIHPNVKDEVKSLVGDLTQLETNGKSSIVVAFNELMNVIGSRDILAESLGSPISADDSLDVMASKINNITRAFKDKLTSLGINISGTEKYNELVNKLNGISLGKKSKSGVFTEKVDSNTTATDITLTIPCDLDFTPSYIVVQYNGTFAVGDGNSTLSNPVVTNTSKYCSGGNSSSSSRGYLQFISYSAASKTITIKRSARYSSDGEYSDGQIKWFACE